ncbi:hypothetical protein [Algihabitans sp.]|uniref:hypothetical protein n=1 Tax=Algihabitans sp. TaxID=2821514 RepID=UPI003BA9571F
MSEDKADLEALARRTLDLMQDQISALAADRQSAEQMQRWLQTVLQISGPMAATQLMVGTMSANALAGWAGLWQQGLAGAAAAEGTERSDAGKPRPSDSPPSGAAPLTAASGDGGARLEQLEARLAELEAALARAGHDQPPGSGGASRGSAAGRRKRKA